MPSHRYASLPDAELEAAFNDDNDDNDNDDQHTTPHTPAVVPGAYDFEREYDYPPPGSPPAPSQHALPNDYGNSNGLLPTSPAIPPPRARLTRPSFLRRAVGALLPSHYIRVPSTDPTPAPAPAPIIGSGSQNDGVFANVVAKPHRPRTTTATAPDGSIYLVPEDASQKDVPPSYADAQADAVPPYWETTVHAPASASDDPNADLLIDDLPTGSPWVFLANLIVSVFFQFVGFLFTYLLHTTHAAKYGSRAGLGLTLIQFGFYSRVVGGGMDGGDADAAPPPPAAATPTQSLLPIPLSVLTSSPNGTLLSTSPSSSSPSPSTLQITPHDWLAFLLMTLGWFLFLSSVLSYLRLKRWEASVRRARLGPPAPAPSADAVRRDREVRENLAAVFGVVVEEEEEGRGGRRGGGGRRDRGTGTEGEGEGLTQEERLHRDLRAAGLL
ncbi:hypothetical protein H0H92_015554 [Tricholoma furcatifolium]|nr:hypothetical protein H0H92_015554 [Tricholoma furcatifolium]